MLQPRSENRLSLIEQLRLMRFFMPFIMSYWSRAVGVIALSFLLSPLTLVFPYLTKIIIDNAFLGHDLKVYLVTIAGGAGVFLLNELLGAYRDYLEELLRMRVSFDLNTVVIKKMASLDIAYFRARTSGEHMYRFQHDVDRITDQIISLPTQAITLFPRIFFLLGMVFFLNWKMALCALAMTPFVYFSPYYFTKKMQHMYRAFITAAERVYSYLTESFSRMYIVKAFGQEKKLVKKYLEHLRDAMRVRKVRKKIEVISSFWGNTVMRGVTGLIGFAGGYQVIRETMTIGNLTAIMMYFRQLIGLQHSVALFFQQMALGSISCERIHTLLHEIPRIKEDENSGDRVFSTGAIELKNLTFGYTRERPVIENLSASFCGGVCAALVGPSGCGKTTLLNLIVRLYEPCAGELLIDGHPVASVCVSALRRQITIAPQESLLWNDTIENNIRYGVPGASSEEVLEAARVCGIDDFVQALPEGYQTIVGENACTVSEGQKQRISLARAVLSKPKIVVLDEALSSVDAATEQLVLKNIKAVLPDLTLLIVSHRRSTIASADIVYYLKSAGQIVAGKPDALLASDQGFHDLIIAMGT